MNQRAKQQEIKRIKYLIGVFQREKKWFQVDQLKNLLKRVKMI